MGRDSGRRLHASSVRTRPRACPSVPVRRRFARQAAMAAEPDVPQLQLPQSQPPPLPQSSRRASSRGAADTAVPDLLRSAAAGCRGTAADTAFQAPTIRCESSGIVLKHKLATSPQVTATLGEVKPCLLRNLRVEQSGAEQYCKI